MIPIIQIMMAVAMLFAGRKLFWFFVGAIGFITTTEWAMVAFAEQPSYIVLGIGLMAGVIGALLAIFLRVVGVGLAGFLGGAYLASTLTVMLGAPSGQINLLAVVIGGVFGIVLAYALFDWALVFLSVFSGAFLLAQRLPLRGTIMWVVLAVLVVLGIAVQARQLQEDR